ncbi:hypothetical protein AVEN_217248-1 [Araneus ventricosus]|uniref:Uncharacterized protein n=1 Tax=Araneus ventricosus TaxID=182803 RepID=A0A4Y2SEZ4_ARAVE|nr:hypothetical protein AVEN_217248-1 [Araneus ventricosus]
MSSTKAQAAQITAEKEEIPVHLMVLENFHHFLIPQSSAHCITRKQHRNHFDNHLSELQFLNELNKSAGSSDYSRERRDTCSFNGVQWFLKTSSFPHSTSPQDHCITRKQESISINT